MTETEEIRVMVVDDSSDLTELYRRLLDDAPGLRCVGTLQSADRLVEQVESLRPDIVLLDLTMAGKSPLAALGEVAARFPATRVIAFSGYDDRRTVDAALDAGAWGLISKHLEPIATIEALRSVAKGEVVLRTPEDRARSNGHP
jgi:DNA-binding NarL/FixJ family response regulator